MGLEIVPAIQQLVEPVADGVQAFARWPVDPTSSGNKTLTEKLDDVIRGLKCRCKHSEAELY